jgi:hypothetical protein
VEAVWGPPGTLFHAMAGAPYFNTESVNALTDPTVDQAGRACITLHVTESQFYSLQILGAFNESIFNM